MITTKPLTNSNLSNEDSQKYLNLFWFSIFLGLVGIDRFYRGKWKTGLLKLFSVGGLGIWYVYDIYLIAFGKVRDTNGAALIGYEENAPTVRYSLIAYPFFITVVGFVVYRSYAATTTSTSSAMNSSFYSNPLVDSLGIYLVAAVASSAIGYSFFILFTVVDAIRKEKWVWICLNVLGIALGFTLLNIVYYFIARERPHKQTLV